MNIAQSRAGKKEKFERKKNPIKNFTRQRINQRKNFLAFAFDPVEENYNMYKTDYSCYSSDFENFCSIH